MNTLAQPHTVSPVRAAAAAVAAAIPGAGEVTLHLTPGPDGARELTRADITVDEDEFVDEDADLAVPGPRLATALEQLGWAVETGVTGPVRDDVDHVTLLPGCSAHPGAAALWRACEAVAAVPGTTTVVTFAARA